MDAAGNKSGKLITSNRPKTTQNRQASAKLATEPEQHWRLKKIVN
jgi:hypothetical protein